MDNEKRQGTKVTGVKVFVRHEDVTPEIIKICEVSKPKDNCIGMFVVIPADTSLWKNDAFHGGWAMVTGKN